VTLSWSASAGAQSYALYQGSTSGGEGAVPVQTGITGTSQTVTGLTNGASYFFKVAALGAAGMSAQSSEVSATPDAAPAAPANVAVKAGNGLVALTWSAPAGAQSYSVYQGTASGGEGQTPVFTGVTGTTATVTGLANGTTYFFKVTAVSTAGASLESSEVSATPAAVLTAPTGLTAVPGNDSMTLTWSASAGAQSYTVYQGASSGGEGQVPVLSNITGTSVTVTGLANGTAYFFTVAAVGNTGTSAQSQEASATPGSPQTTVAITGSGSGKSGGGAISTDLLFVLLGALVLRAYASRQRLHG
jgi:fibronectin type 3 domain-containing protein